jgi:hypothetical protein
MTEVALSEFRWRRKQRRLVTDNSTFSNYSELKVIGRSMNLTFIRESGTVVDPYTKTQKLSYLYRPDPKTTPDTHKDLMLYVHI